MQPFIHFLPTLCLFFLKTLTFYNNPLYATASRLYATLKITFIDFQIVNFILHNSTSYSVFKTFKAAGYSFFPRSWSCPCLFVLLLKMCQLTMSPKPTFATFGSRKSSCFWLWRDCRSIPLSSGLSLNIIVPPTILVWNLICWIVQQLEKQIWVCALS